MTVSTNLPENLWPDYQQMSKYADQPPIEILTQQAMFFGLQTGNVLEAIIKSSAPDDDTGKVYHNFFVRAPFLHNMKKKIFYVAHDIGLYPTDVVLYDNTLYRNCKTSEELKAALFDLFRADSILQQVGNLLAQTNASPPPDTSEDGS